MQQNPLANLDGIALMPSDPQYEEARQPWLRNHDSRPALVVLAASVSDVQKAVRYASASDLPIAIQSSGHGAIKSTDGAVLIKTERMQQLSIDSDAQTATFEPGVIAKKLVDAAAEYDLSPITGDSPYVSSTGFTLGGGMGWLSRQYGFGADSIVAATIVTADGNIVTASDTDHPELLWAIKGGSGNFGVVVSLTVKLHSVQRGFGGSVNFAADDAQKVLEQYSTWAQTLPESSTAFLQAVSMPPIPQLPASISGKRVIIVQLFCNGDPVAAKEALDHLIEATGCTPLANFTGEMTYANFLDMTPSFPPAASVSATSLQSTITPEQIPVLASFMQGSADLSAIVQIRPWGGVLAHPQQDSLLQYAEVGFSIYGVASLRGDGAAQAQTKEAFAPLAEHLAQYASGKQFINFSGSLDAVQHAYSDESLQKLRTAKQTYDPKNLFRMGHTIEQA